MPLLYQRIQTHNGSRHALLALAEVIEKDIRTGRDVDSDAKHQVGRGAPALCEEDGDLIAPASARSQPARGGDLSGAQGCQGYVRPGKFERGQ